MIAQNTYLYSIRISSFIFICLCLLLIFLLDFLILFILLGIIFVCFKKINSCSYKKKISLPVPLAIFPISGNTISYLPFHRPQTPISVTFYSNSITNQLHALLVLPRKYPDSCQCLPPVPKMIFCLNHYYLFPGQYLYIYSIKQANNCVIISMGISQFL